MASPSNTSEQRTSYGVAAATLEGHLGNDPEMVYTDGGVAVVTLRVAIARGLNTDWFTTKLWGKAAETANELLQKGDHVLVMGKLQVREYVSNLDGNKRQVTEVHVNDVFGLRLLGRSAKAAAAGSEVPEHEAPPQDGDQGFDPAAETRTPATAGKRR